MHASRQSRGQHDDTTRHETHTNTHTHAPNKEVVEHRAICIMPTKVFTLLRTVQWGCLLLRAADDAGVAFKLADGDLFSARVAHAGGLLRVHFVACATHYYSRYNELWLFLGGRHVKRLYGRPAVRRQEMAEKLLFVGNPISAATHNVQSIYSTLENIRISTPKYTHTLTSQPRKQTHTCTHTKPHDDGRDERAIS